MNNNISWYNVCLASMSKDFTKDEQIKMSLNGTVYNFSVDHSSIKKEDILSIHQYLTIKSNIKPCLKLLKNIFIELLTSVVNASSHTKMCILR